MKRKGSLAKETVETVGGAVGHALGAALRASGLRAPRAHRARREPGASPGIERAPQVDVPPPAGTVTIRCIDYGPKGIETAVVEDVDELLRRARPEWAKVRWINVDGLHPYTIARLRQEFGFHTLAAEDVLNVPQRPKQEPYEDHLFVVARMLMMRDGGLANEQVSIVLFPDEILTFQERAGDVWDPVRKRLETEGSRIRSNGSAYLLYTLLDAIVDHFFPILEHYGDQLEEIEQRIVERPTTAELHRLYGVKRDLVLLRRVMWPMRQTMDELYRSEFKGIDKHVRTFLRDVYDHAIHVIDIIESYREMASGLTDLYMSSISNRMNEIMKVLTIMASLFIPITFLAGVYGMNFEHIPELAWRWAYPTFWVLCGLTLLGLLVYFQRKGWIGGR